MSFSRVVFVLLTLLLALLLAASFALNVVHARHYLSRQLAVHAQDSATAMGLSLAPMLQRGDRVAMDSLVKAVGDGGYFRWIRVFDTQGSVLAERVSSLDVADVPAWFVRWLPLETPTRSALIMDGWREAGRVEISSHPGYAYQQLWSDARDLLFWFAVVGALALVLLIALARSALKPLAAMEQQALAIGDGHFSLRVPPPWARELRQVTEAMNKMTRKVDEMLRSKVRAIEKLEAASHRDALTGLYTRDFIDQKICILLRENDACAHAALLLIRLADLAYINTQWGYIEGDALLKQIAALMRGQERQLQSTIAARSGGTEFMLLVSELTHEEALQLANTLLSQIRACTTSLGACTGSAHIGIGFLDPNISASSQLFAEADMALRVAENHGRFWAFMYPPEDLSPDMIFGASRWRQIIERALAQRTFLLFEQPVLDARSGLPLHYELEARIRDEDGRLIGAGAYMPMAHRLGLANAIDRAVVELALTHPFPDAVPRVLNLSLDSIKDLVFTTWLQQRLRMSALDASRIQFELPERAVAEVPECVSRLISCLDALEIRFGFDHIGILPEALAQMRHMRPMFLKCDQVLVAGADATGLKRSLLEMLLNLAQALDSVFIVSGIETEQHAMQIRAMGVGALQGRAVGVASAVPTA